MRARDKQCGDREARAGVGLHGDQGRDGVRGMQQDAGLQEDQNLPPRHGVPHAMLQTERVPHHQANL